MNVYIDTLVNGILIGLIYGLAAMGLALIWGVLKVINLSHGAFITLGMFLSYLIFKYFHIPPYISVFFTLIIGFILGFIAYFISLHKIVSHAKNFKEYELSSLLSTFSLSLIITGFLLFIFATTPMAINLPLSLFETKLLASFFSILFTIALSLFLYKTYMGKAIRAVSQNIDAAKLMGVNTTLILATSFAIGVSLAMAAGTLIAMVFPFSTLSGVLYELKSFIICVIGGLGNPIGTIVGGIILGLLENFFGLFVNQGLVPFIEFTILILLLLFKPNGLFGGSK